MNSLPLSVQFKSECYKRYFVENPDDAQELAIAYFEQFTVLADKYKQLEAQNKLLKSALKKAHQANPPSLPKFIDPILDNSENNSPTTKLPS